MTLSTWQLIVVGLLAAIWAVVLGVPLLADLLRWLRNRPPAPRIDRRSSHRNFIESLEHSWWKRPRPIVAWRTQDVVRRRLQILLACGMAATASMFLAIALRGLFVPLFLLMIAISLLVLAVGAFIGGHEHRNLRSQRVNRARNQVASVAGPVGRPEAGAEPMIILADDVPTANPWQEPDGEYTIPTIAEIAEAFRPPERAGFMFEPLNLDEALTATEGAGPEVDGATPDMDAEVEVPVNPDLVAELGLDIDQTTDVRFSAAPEAGSRQASARARQAKRNNARPIYIESVLDDGDGQDKVMND